MTDAGRLLVWLGILACLAIFWIGVYTVGRWIAGAIW